MDALELLLDLHINGDRQGPGGDDATRLSIALSGLKSNKNLTIADIGCGTGASTLILAQELDAQIKAIDFLPSFVAKLDLKAQKLGLAHKIETSAISMENLPFEAASLDAIWSEGAIYNIGFENGIKQWNHFIKPGGVLAISELTWTTKTRPDELADHWNTEYPEVALASDKVQQLEKNGYMLLGYFPLQKSCWLDNYYHPLEKRFDAYLAKHTESSAAQSIIDAERHEISLYKKYSDYISYGYYVARKLPI